MNRLLDGAHSSTPFGLRTFGGLELFPSSEELRLPLFKILVPPLIRPKRPVVLKAWLPAMGDSETSVGFGYRSAIFSLVW